MQRNSKFFLMQRAFLRVFESDKQKVCSRALFNARGAQGLKEILVSELCQMNHNWFRKCNLHIPFEQKVL
jgi:hypothetical protein